MHKIHIIRHGAPVEDNGEGNLYSASAPLSPLGLEQVKTLSKLYSNRNIIFDKIYASPLPRALETAQQLPHKGESIFILEGLREPDWGRLVGKPFSSFQSLENKKGYNLYADDAGQESFSGVVVRVQNAFKKILEGIDKEEEIAIVSHGLISKIGMNMLRNPYFIPTSELDLSEADQLANAQSLY